MKRLVLVGLFCLGLLWQPVAGVAAGPASEPPACLGLILDILSAPCDLLTMCLGGPGPEYGPPPQCYRKRRRKTTHRAPRYPGKASPPQPIPRAKYDRNGSVFPKAPASAAAPEAPPRRPTAAKPATPKERTVTETPRPVERTPAVKREQIPRTPAQETRTNTRIEEPIAGPKTERPREVQKKKRRPARRYHKPCGPIPYGYYYYYYR